VKPVALAALAREAPWNRPTRSRSVVASTARASPQRARSRWPGCTTPASPPSPRAGASRAPIHTRSVRITVARGRDGGPS